VHRVGSEGSGLAERCVSEDAMKRMLFLVAFISALLVTSRVWAAQSHVRIQNNQLLVSKRLANGTLDLERKYTIKLVNWSPCRIGDSSGLRFSQNYQTDIPPIRGMNANTVRVFDVLDYGTNEYISTNVLDELYRNGLMVIMTAVWDHRVMDESYVKGVVRHFRDHPAILMWALGNEWNLWSEHGKLYYDAFADPGALAAAKAATEQAAQWIKQAYQEVGLSPVPVASSLVYYWDEGAPNEPWEPFSYYRDIVQSCPSIDAYGINMYQEPAKYVLFMNEWARAGFSQPLFLAEFGSDAFNSAKQSEDQDAQAEYDACIWKTIRPFFSAQDFRQVVLGGGVFEFNDEWWKMGAPFTHDVTGGADPDIPDGYRSEEWTGIVDAFRNPRRAYDRLAESYPLREEWNLQGSVALAVKSSSDQSDPNFTCYSRFYVNGLKYWNAIIDKTNRWARGMNILILDARTLAILDARNFDLYEEPHGEQPAEAAMRQFLTSLLPSSIAMISVSDTATWWEGPWFEPATINLFQSFGSTLINQLQFRQPYALIFRKNADSTFTLVAEQIGQPGSQVTLEASLPIESTFAIDCDIDDSIAAAQVQGTTLTDAAAIETQLRYTQQATRIVIPSQQDLHDLAIVHNLSVNAGLPLVDPDGLAGGLNAMQRPLYNYAAYALPTSQEALAYLAPWISYKVPNAGPRHSPGFIVARGDNSANCYKEWVMVVGFHSDLDPQQGRPYTVKELWLRDFSVPPGQPGANVLVSAEEFLARYLKPLQTPNPTDPYNGRYAVVVEPPFPLNTRARVERASSWHVADLNGLAEEAHDLMTGLRETRRHAGESRLYVASERGGYLLVARPSQKNPRISSAFFVVGPDGAFKAYSWTDKPAPLLKVDRRAVKRLIWSSLGEWPADGELSLVQRTEDSPFRPVWKYRSRQGCLYYVDQNSRVNVAVSP